MIELYFIRPHWLLALFPLILLLIYLRRRKVYSSQWRQEVDAHLLQHIIVTDNNTIHNRSNLLQRWHWLGLCWFIGTIALSGPAWDKTEPFELIQDRPPLVIVLNLSKQMHEKKTNKDFLIRMQSKLVTLLSKIHLRPVTMLVYSNKAYQVLPLTEDEKLISYWLNYLTPEIMPADGNNLSSALQLASNIFAASHNQSGYVLLITDVVDEMVRKNLTQDSEDQFELISYVYSRTALPTTDELNTDDYPNLQYYSKNEDDINSLVQRLNHYVFESDYKIESYKNSVQIWKDRGAWMILLLLPIALGLFRSRQFLIFIPAVITTSLLTFMPFEAYAFDWKNIWYNNNERAMRIMPENPELAEQLFSDPFWRAIAQYRQEKYQQAIDNFSRVESDLAYYNKANTLVKLGLYEQAIESYQKAIEHNPELKSAHHNLKLLKAFINTSYDNKQMPDTLKNNTKKIPEGVKKDRNDISEQMTVQNSVKQREQNKILKQQGLHKKSDTESRADQQQEYQPSLPGEIVVERAVIEKNSALKKANNNRKTFPEQQPAKNQRSQTGSSSNSTINNRSDYEQGESKDKSNDNYKKNSKDNSKEKKQIKTAIRNNEAKTDVTDSNINAKANSDSIVNKKDLNKTISEISLTDNKEKNYFVKNWLESIEDDPRPLLKEVFRRQNKKSNKSKNREEL